MNNTFLFGLLLTIGLAYADQGSGTLSMNCPATSPTTCAGGSLTFASNDGTSTINAVFTSGSDAESCYGGGKGGNIKCYFNLTGYIRGTWTLNGASQAIIGVTYQSFPASGTTGKVQGTRLSIPPTPPSITPTPSKFCIPTT